MFTGLAYPIRDKKYSKAQKCWLYTLEYGQMSGDPSWNYEGVREDLLRPLGWKLYGGQGAFEDLAGQ